MTCYVLILKISKKKIFWHIWSTTRGALAITWKYLKSTRNAANFYHLFLITIVRKCYLFSTKLFSPIFLLRLLKNFFEKFFHILFYDVTPTPHVYFDYVLLNLSLEDFDFRSLSTYSFTFILCYISDTLYSTMACDRAVLRPSGALGLDLNWGPPIFQNFQNAQLLLVLYQATILQSARSYKDF